MKDATTEIDAAAQSLAAHLAKAGIKSAPVFFAVHLPMTAAPNGPMRGSYGEAFEDVKRMSGPADIAFALPNVSPQTAAGWDSTYRARFDELSRILGEKMQLASLGGKSPKGS